MKKLFVYVGIVFLLQGCIALQSRHNNNIVNEIATILRSHGYETYNIKQKYRRTNEWGYAEYTNFWYFSNGNNKLFLSFFSGDVDSPKPMVFSNNKLDGNLENELRNKNVFVTNLGEMGRQIVD